MRKLYESKIIFWEKKSQNITKIKLQNWEKNWNIQKRSVLQNLSCMTIKSQ